MKMRDVAYWSIPIAMAVAVLADQSFIKEMTEKNYIFKEKKDLAKKEKWDIGKTAVKWAIPIWITEFITLSLYLGAIDEAKS